MNLRDLLEKNNVIIFNHFRIISERCMYLIIYDESLSESGYSTFIYTHDMNKLNETFKDNFDDAKLLIDDDIEMLRNSVCVFLSIALFNEFELKRQILSKMIEYNIRVIVLNGLLTINPHRLVESKGLKYEIVNVPFTYYDKIIPIILFEDEDKISYIQTLKELNQDSDHIVIDKYDQKIINENSLHFVNVPSLKELDYIRSRLTVSFTSMFFYITYSNSGDITEEGIKFNKLIKEIHTREKIKYHRNLKIKDQKIVYE